MKRKEKSQRQRRQSWEGSDAEVGTESTETNGEQGPAVPGPHSSVLVSLVPEDVSWLVERERQRGAWRERHAQLFLGYCILCAPSWSLTIKQASPILAGREWSPPPTSSHLCRLKSCAPATPRLHARGRCWTAPRAAPPRVSR
jgi:hypothetical protein